MSIRYSLRVSRVKDVVWKPVRGHNKVPDLYVEVKLGNMVQRTNTIKKETSPIWNETLSFSSSSDSPAHLSIQLKHNLWYKTFKLDPRVGCVNVGLVYLLEKCSDGEASLNLLSSPDKDSKVTANIYLHLEIVDMMTSTRNNVENALRDVELKPFARSADAAESSAITTVSGATGLAEQQGDLYQSIGRLMEKLDVIADIVDEVSKIHPYLNAAWSVTSSFYKLISNQFKADKKVVDLAHAIEEAYSFASDVQSLPNKVSTLESVIIRLLAQTTECCIFIREYTHHSFPARMANLLSKDKIDEFIGSLQSLKISLNSGMAFNTAFISARTFERVEDLYLQQHLNPTQTTAFYRPLCLDGTRVEIREQIVSWLLSNTPQNVLWLHGVAGSGKSTISTTIKEFFSDMSRLGAFLFFERGKSDPASVIRTMAYQLSLSDPTIRSHIVASVNQNHGIASLDSASTQFEKLLLQPLNSAAAAIEGPIIIILDALDECGTSDTRSDLIRLFKQGLPKLSPIFRFLITSRPENDLVKALSSRSNSICEIELDYKSDASRNDVLCYIKYEMQIAVRDEVEVPKDWPWDANMSFLGEAAAGLFIWASTAVKLVSSCKDDPFQKLKDLVSDSRSLGVFGLNNLYATVLENSGISWNDNRSKARFSQVLGLILFSKIPLSVAGIDGILGFSSESSSRLILSRLQCLLAYTPDAPIRLFHASFSDYLLSPERAHDPWFIDIGSQKQMIATRCFDVMANLLRFNICNLETSFVRNDEVTGLNDRIKENIPPSLEYACRFWGEHLLDIPSSPYLLDKLSTFAHHQLLYWFEVLSLTMNFSRLAGRALLDALRWTASKHTEISSFLWDAYRLTSIFALPISQSTPHIYLSALPLTKGESIVSEHYSRRISPVVLVHRLGIKAPTSCIKTFKGHTHVVTSVAFSPDGKRVVSGSVDKTIRVWDAESGEVASGPFQGHTSSVDSVAFSLDGKRIVSGSDEMILVWDAESGKIVSGPFQGHTDSITSVMFSPDGKQIVSGSHDKTIRVWDAGSGEIVSGPFQGHTSGVTSVAFSPDGTWIVSGSEDETIFVWDAESGEVVSGPFQGHTSSVDSVAFSPDGKRIVSGSYDRTIHVWDAGSGEIVSGPFQGHTSGVTSVAFSPDGKQIVSGSGDRTMQVWDAESGEVISGPFQGHMSDVTSVMFSPDGKRIVSGSYDETIRMWDAESGEVVSGPFQRHAHRITSVAFSPDGKQIVSGSHDKTIRVWDAGSGEIVSGPFQAHTSGVTSVEFSPDGTWIVSGSEDETIFVWDAESGGIVSGPFQGHTHYVTSVAFSPDGKRIVSGSYDRTIRVWDAGSGEIVSGPFQGHTHRVTSAAFSPDGKRIVSGSFDRTIRVWDAGSGEAVSGPFQGHMHRVTSVAFSPDGTWIVSGSEDETILVWDAESGEIVSGPFQGHMSGVTSVAFSPDGKRIVSGSKDETILVWDAESGEVVSGPFQGHTHSVTSIAFSPDGKRIVSGSKDLTIRVWDAESESMLPKSLEVNINSSWVMSEEGWILGKQGELLLWIPPDIRSTLWRPDNTAVFSCPFSTRVDFIDHALGENWHTCFSSFEAMML